MLNCANKSPKATIPGLISVSNKLLLTVWYSIPLPGVFAGPLSSLVCLRERQERLIQQSALAAVEFNSSLPPQQSAHCSGNFTCLYLSQDKLKVLILGLVTFHSGTTLPHRRKSLSALLHWYLKPFPLEHCQFAGHAQSPHAHKCHTHQSTSGSSCVSPLQTWSNNGTRAMALFNTSPCFSFTSLWCFFL